MRFLVSVLIFITFLVCPGIIYATYDPVSVPNNKYGIHIADFNDLPDIPALVNSSGGDWGYVTLVSTDSDRNKDKWQEMFNMMRRTHLIPIVRIATHVERDHWAIPNPVDFDKIVTFFQSLNWPTENRYIVLYNEPNHAKEWGDTLNPEEYARYVTELGKKFKQASSDFFILPAGIDVSAGNDSQTMDATSFIRRMVSASPDIFSVIDGWTSHSYPNPGFSGSPYAVGRGTLTSYEWELSLLQQLGLNKQLPVFITETGWNHNQGKAPQPNLLNPLQVGNNLQIAAANVWSDDRIVAVTPFVFNYQDYPFDNFSWKQLGNNSFYAHYFSYQAIQKIHGKPLQHEAYVLSDPILPLSLVARSTYSLQTEITNVGEGIMSPADYSLELDNSAYTFSYDRLPTLEPNEKGTLTIHLTTPANSHSDRLRLTLVHNSRKITLQETDITLVPPPSISVRTQLGWRGTSDAKNVKVLIYDKNSLIQEADNLSLTHGMVTMQGIANIIPGKSYRIVIVVPFYLPRQQFSILNKNTTTVEMKRMLPFDINEDGRFTLTDLVDFFRHPPKDYLHLFIGP